MERYGKRVIFTKKSTVEAIAKANQELQSKIYSKSDQNPCTFSVLDSSVML